MSEICPAPSVTTLGLCRDGCTYRAVAAAVGPAMTCTYVRRSEIAGIIWKPPEDRTAEAAPKWTRGGTLSSAPHVSG
jgi:hypothetical protein